MQSIEEINKIKEFIEGVDVVSFDIFDTLLLRNVLQPKDIFEAVEFAYYTKLGKKIDFKRKRILAEKKARQASYNEDITYDEIYKEIEKIFPAEYEKLKNLEIELEEKFLICNTQLLKVYNFAQEKGKKILIISDMYLPQDVLERILRNKGYIGEHKVYISSNSRKSKATGTLYEYIRNKESIDENQKWVHIGDNYIADCKNAEKAQISPWYYKAVRERYPSYRYKNLTESIMYALQINKLYLEDEDKGYWYNFGMSKAAPLYIGFMRWLKDSLKGKENVYFLARDGYLPFKLYEQLYKKDKNLPKGKYLYASRRAYIYPNLPDMQRKEALDILMTANKGLGQSITLSEILGNIGLDYRNYSDILVEHGIHCVDKLIESEAEDKVIRGFLEEIWGDIEEVLRTEKVVLQEYFQQEGLYDYETINIVDIGWSGSTHKSLQQLLENKVNGYYLGTIRQIYEEIRQYSKAYLFNEGNPRKIKNLVMENVMIFEFLFSAPMGSVKNFIKEGQIIYPVKLREQEEVKTNEYILALQDGIENLFHEVIKYDEFLSDQDIKQFAIDCLTHFIKQQSVIDLNKFLEISTPIGIGEAKQKQNYILKVKAEEYLKNKRSLSRESKKLLWKGAIIIEDAYGRFFNQKEYNTLYKVNGGIDFLIVEELLQKLKKAIKNPKKVLLLIKRLI